MLKVYTVIFLFSPFSSLLLFWEAITWLLTNVLFPYLLLTHTRTHKHTHTTHTHTHTNTHSIKPQLTQCPNLIDQAGLGANQIWRSTSSPNPPLCKTWVQKKGKFWFSWNFIQVLIIVSKNFEVNLFRWKGLFQRELKWETPNKIFYVK
jgi:hypothetical protein